MDYLGLFSGNLEDKQEVILSPTRNYVGRHIATGSREGQKDKHSKSHHMNATCLLSTTAAWGSEAPASLLAGNGASPQGRTALQEIPLLHLVPELHGQAPDRPSSPSPVRANLGTTEPQSTGSSVLHQPQAQSGCFVQSVGRISPLSLCFGARLFF